MPCAQSVGGCPRAPSSSRHTESCCCHPQPPPFIYSTSLTIHVSYGIRNTSTTTKQGYATCYGLRSPARELRQISSPCSGYWVASGTCGSLEGYASNRRPADVPSASACMHAAWGHVVSSRLERAVFYRSSLWIPPQFCSITG